MKKLELNDELRRAAERCVWYKPAEAAIEDPIDFAAHVLTYGIHEDVKSLRQQLSDDDLRNVLKNAPAGVFDKRSWHYWHLILHADLPEQMPQRSFG